MLNFIIHIVTSMCKTMTKITLLLPTIVSYGCSIICSGGYSNIFFMGEDEEAIK